MVRKLNAVFGVIKLENKYFVVRNIDPDEDFNFWEFPSGAAQNGDNPLEDLTRIFKQKLGLKIEKSEPLYKVTHSYSSFDITVHAYLVECDKLPTKVKYTESKFVTLEELIKLKFTPAHYEVISEIVMRYREN